MPDRCTPEYERILSKMGSLAAYGRAVALIESDGRFLDNVEARVHSRQTGACWQRKAFEAYGRDMYKLMAAYCERQRSGAPVHEWDP